MPSITLYFILTVYLALFSSIAFANTSSEMQQAENSNPVVDVAQIDAVFKFGRSLHEMLDQTKISVPALQQKLGNEPEVLYDWVASNTAWVPYQGVLKGPAGTLHSKRGNSWDRALLYASLLNSAGIESKIVWASVPRELKKIFVSKAQEHLQSTLPVSVIDEWDLEALSKVAIDNNVNLDVLTSVYNDWSSTRENLFLQVGSISNNYMKSLLASKEFEELALASNLDREIEDALKLHVWVEHAKSGGGWVKRDFFLNHGNKLSADIDLGLERLGSANFEKVPDRYLHTTSVRVLAETKESENIQSHLLLEHDFTALNNAIDEFTIAFEPVDGIGVDFDLLIKDTPTHLQNVYASQSAWIPSIVSQSGTLKHNRIFTKDGEILDGPPSGFVDTIKSTTSSTSAIDALGSATSDQEHVDTELKRIYVEWESRLSDKQHFLVTRDIYNSENTGTSYNSVAEAVSRNVTAIVQTARIPQEYVDDRVLSRMSSMRLPAIYMAKKFSSGLADVIQVVNKVSPRIDSSTFLPLELSSSRLLRDTYLSEPNVISAVVQKSSISGDKLGFVTTLDIISNRVSATSIAGFGETLEVGVLDTVLESEIGNGFEDNTVDSVITREEMIDGPYLSLLTSESIKSKNYPVIVSDYMQEHIDNGYLFLAKKKSDTTWWKVNRATGNIIGEYLRDGEIYGAASVEQVVKVLWASTKVFGYFTTLTQACSQYQVSSSEQMGCAMCATFALTVALFGSGMAGHAGNTLSAYCALAVSQFDKPYREK